MFVCVARNTEWICVYARKNYIYTAFGMYVGCSFLKKERKGKRFKQ